MSVALYHECQIVAQCEFSLIWLQLLEHDKAPQRLRYLDVNEVRRVKVLPRIENTVGHALGTHSPQQ